MESVNYSMNQTDLLEAVRTSLEEAASGPDGALTTTEIVEQTGQSRKAVKQSLRALKKAGRLRPVKVRREALDGYMRPTTAYQILPEADAD